MNPLDNYQDDASLDQPSITAREYENGTTKAVRTIGKDMGLDVIFAGEQAMTDGKHVILPKQHDGKMMTQRQVLVGRGFADHETLHNLLTDFQSNSPKMRGFKEQGKHLTERFAQAIEDVRIENGGGALYPGMPDDLNDTAHWAAKHFLDNGYRSDPSVSNDLRRVGPIAVTWAGRQKMGYESPLIEAALGTLPADLRKTVERWADMALALKTGCQGPGNLNKHDAYQGSRDGCDLAELVAAEAVNEQQQQQPPQGGEGEGEGDGKGKSNGQGQSGSGEDGEGGSSAPGEGEGQGQGEGDGIPQGQVDVLGDGVEPSTDEPQGSQGDTQSGSGGAVTHDHGNIPQGGGDTEPQPYDPNLDASVSELMKQGDNQQGTRRNDYRTFSTAEDFVFEKGKVHKNVDGDDVHQPRGMSNVHGVKKYMDILRDCGGSLAMMRRKLERAIMARQNNDWEGGRRRGKLDRRGLIRAVGGGKNVFKQRVEGDVIDTAVSIVIDLSGSMSYNRINIAQQSAIAMAEALDSTGVVLEVVGFSNDRNYSRTLHVAHRKDSGSYSRTVPVDLMVFKSFEDRLRQCRQAMGNINRLADGLTPDGPGMMMAWDRLKVRDEEKKIMLVMADGGSGWAHDHGHNPSNHTRDVVAALEKAGCHVVGLGIQSDEVSLTFPKWVEVSNLDNLSKEVMSQIAKLILGDRFVIDNGDLLAASGRKVA